MDSLPEDAGGGIDIARLRRSLAGLPLPRAADGRLMLASLQSCQPSDHHGRNTRRSASYVPFGNPTRSGQTAVTVYSLLVLPLTAHNSVVEPKVVRPPPSRAVLVPRLTMWKLPLPALCRLHCWLLPPFHAA